MRADRKRWRPKCYLVEVEMTSASFNSDKITYSCDMIGYTYNFMIVRWLYNHLDRNLRVTEYASVEDLEADVGEMEAADLRVFSHMLDCPYDKKGNMYPPVFEDDDVTIDTAYDDFMVCYQMIVTNFYDAIADFMKDGDLKDIFSSALMFMSELLYADHPRYSFDDGDDNDFFDALRITARWLCSEEGKETYYYGEY